MQMQIWVIYVNNQHLPLGFTLVHASPSSVSPRSCSCSPARHHVDSYSCSDTPGCGSEQIDVLYNASDRPDSIRSTAASGLKFCKKRGVSPVEEFE